MIDELCASLIGELVSGRMALPVATDMALVPRFYQRLADHRPPGDLLRRICGRLAAAVAS